MRFAGFLTVLFISLYPARSLSGAVDGAAQRPVEMKAVDVVSRPVPGENKIVGTYDQPEWTARRPFPGVSVYVVPEGEFELELALDSRREAHATTDRNWTQELEIGLGHRLQLTLQNSVRNFLENRPGPTGWREDSLDVSLRYALGDWGKLLFNPALSAGLRLNSGGSPAALVGLVIGDELTPRWHWAANLDGDGQFGGPSLREVTADVALTYSILNETLSLGMQAGARSVHGHGVRGANYGHFGPCVQFRPWDELHVNGVCLWSDGSHGASRFEFLLSVGFEFGDGADDHDEGPRLGGNFDR